MRAGVVQLNSGSDRDLNLERAEPLVRAVAAAGADFVSLPEKWNLLGSTEQLAAGAEPLDGPTLSAAAGWARELGIHLLAGSIVEAREDGSRSNTSVLLSPDGERLAVYRKIHMFDVDVGGVSYRESDGETPGEEPVLAAIEGSDGVVVGLTVCYDLRFPELHRLLAVEGANLFTCPSAFTVATGRDHWDVLHRARAIENQAFVVAAGQWGSAPPHFESYGRSLICDPWGTVLARVPDGEGHACADLDFASLRRLRETLPSLANRRPSAYRLPSAAGSGR